jgi:G3E family GTPase
MKLLIVAGFLGSGKTTLLLEIVKPLSAASQKIAIIENEIGDIGVDGEYLNLEGLQVQELFGGCICCTLSVGLLETLEDLERLYQPDLVILETTGVARPGDIVDNVRKYKPGIQEIQVIALVDADRYEMLLEVMEPLVTSQIAAADIVAVNKIDKVTGGALNEIMESVANLNSHATITPVSADRGIGLKTIMDALR